MTRWPACWRADRCEMTWCWARNAACCAAVACAGSPCTRCAAAARLSAGLGDPLADPAAAELVVGRTAGDVGPGPLLFAPPAGWPPDELHPAAARTPIPAAAAPSRCQRRSVPTTATSVAPAGGYRRPENEPGCSGAG